MAAASTEAVQLQPVSLDDKAVLRRDLLLQPFNLTIFEFYDSATAGADEMIVMALMRDIVVLRLRAEVARLGSFTAAAEQLDMTVQQAQHSCAQASGS